MKKYKTEITLLIILIVIGQIIFAILSPKFMSARYESRIYGTTGVSHDNSDLHKLNEAAHYFGQTIIGWTKFPSFMENLKKEAHLPDDASLNAHIQERQNIIFTVYTSEQIDKSILTLVKDFIQEKMNEYNSTNKTQFVLSNLDYEQIKVQKTYTFGAITAFAISLIIGIGLLFVRKEFLM